jgi:spore coat protein A
MDREGQLRYPTSDAPESPWVPELFGDVTLVNGKIYPYLEVEPRPYRFRVVNASNSRLYYLALSNGDELRQIGTDQGLLPEPVAQRTVTVAPGERADLVIDFSSRAGASFTLKSQSFELMQFRVSSEGPKAAVAALPKKLRGVPRIAESSAVKTRILTLNEYEDPKTHRMQMLLNGAYWRDPVTETPRLGSVEIWNLMNLTEDTHPIHLHLVRFQILDRHQFDADEYLTSKILQLVGKPVPPRPEEAGWKDTVRAEPGLLTRIIVKFDGYTGRYVWHCHLLEHAANEMMRPFDVLPNA